MDKLEIKFRLKDMDRTLGFQNEISLGISYSLDPAFLLLVNSSRKSKTRKIERCIF